MYAVMDVSECFKSHQQLGHTETGPRFKISAEGLEKRRRLLQASLKSKSWLKTRRNIQFWLNNIDKITEPYGKIQKVIINGPKEQRDDKEKDEKPVTKTATVAFTDIKSASNAHKAEKKIGNNLLTSECSEGFAASGTLVTRTHEPEIFPRAPGYPNRKGCDLGIRWRRCG